MTLAVLPRFAGAALVALMLTACAKNDLSDPPVDLGPFRLGLNIVVADNMQKVPISRDATADEWETGIKKAIADRFGRYDGDRFYNIGINVDGYALAPPGIPVVAAPKSVVVVSANVWDDATGTRLNPEPKQFTVFETLSGDTVIGSGLISTKQEQLDALSVNVAKAVEGWFLENPQWFAAAGAIPGAAPETGTPAPAPRVVSAQPAAAQPAAPAVAVIPAAPAAATTNPAIRPVRRPDVAAPAN